nr:winged helix-turn-helix transcriptional regulator [Candidatus Aenigmarchaeota archaeon]
MKKRIQQVFFELIKNSKKSDRDIAKKLKISQPTVTRIRKNLEKNGYIIEYSVMPNLPKLGFEIGAFIFFNVDRRKNEKMKHDGHKWIAKHPNIIFAAGGDGIRGKNCMIASLHKNFTGYTKFIRSFKTMFGNYIKDVESFLVPLADQT